MAIKTKKKQIEQNEAKTVLESVKDIKIGDVVSQVNNLQVTLQKTLADLCATVTTKVQQMEQLDTAIALKDQRLQELYNIEKEAVTIDEIRTQREQERENWEQERENRYKTWQEEEKEHLKERNRTEDEWKYNFEQLKKRTQEDFQNEISRSKRNEEIRKENLERNWSDRENELKARESELQVLRNQVQGFEDRLKEAVKNAEAAGNASATMQYQHQIALLKKDTESAKAVSDMRISSLTAQISGLVDQIEDLQAQLATARQDAKDVASEALKSAANRQLSETLQKVVTDIQPSKNK